MNARVVSFPSDNREAARYGELDFLVTPADHDMAALVSLARDFPVEGWGFSNWPYEASAASGLLVSSLSNDLQNRIAEKVARHGFAVIDLHALFDSHPAPVRAGAVTLFTSLFGRPIRVFDRTIEFWRKVDVDLLRPAGRSRGIGAQGLHLDFVNASNPPDFVCLLCIRADPLGGGQSVLARLDDVELALDESEVAVLRNALFSDGKVEALREVGTDINPFAVISPGTGWRYRVTAALLEADLPEAALRAIRHLHAVLEARAIRVLLAPGDLLVIDQHRAAHGRAGLGLNGTGSGQDLVPVTERRLLLHSFVRA